MKPSLLRTRILLALFCAALILSGCGNGAGGGSWTISGRVIWGGTTTGVQAATVKIGTVSGTTDPDGSFVLQGTGTGSAEMVVTHEQAVEYRENVILSSLSTLTDIGLKRLYYVSSDGDDANPGTGSAPFGTIQHAFSQPGWKRVMLNNGTYDSTTQTFPFIMGESDELIGGGGDVCIIRHNATVCKVHGVNARIEGIRFDTPADTCVGSCIFVGNADTGQSTPAGLSITGCSLRGWQGGSGILAGAESTLVVKECAFTGNTYGIRFLGDSLTVRRSAFHAHIAAAVDVASPPCMRVDLGNRTEDGQNDFSGNPRVALCDERLENSGLIYAIGNTWDPRNPPPIMALFTETGDAPPDSYWSYSIINPGNNIVFSRKVLLRGKIYISSALTSEKVQGVQIKVADQTAYSGPDGTFETGIFSAGTYPIQFNLAGATPSVVWSFHRSVKVRCELSVNPPSEQIFENLNSLQSLAWSTPPGNWPESSYMHVTVFISPND